MLDQMSLENLISIFGFLEYEDLKAVRQTCKICYEASLAYSITKYEVINFNSRMLKPEGKQIILSLMETKRRFFNISISNINYNDYLWFFHKFAKSIRTVTLEECTLNNYQFTSILSKLEKLEKIHLKKCDTLLIEGKVFLPYILDQNQFLKDLIHLEITHSTYLTDECLSRFLILFPNIQKLSIEGITIECHQGSFGLYYKPNSDVLKNPSNQLLTSNYLKALIISKKHNIQGLDFSKTLINNNSLSAILQQKELNLKYLNLNKCRELRYDNNLIFGFCKNNMTELQLSACNLITNSLLSYITSTMVNLKVLNISDNGNIDDDGFKNVGNLYYLSELDVSNCNISGPIVETVLCSKPLSENLKILKLNYIKVSNSNLVNILNSVNLIELQISNCPGLSNHFLKTLWSTQKLLKRLNMSSIEITDMGLTGLDESKLYLPKINLKKYESSCLSYIVQKNEILDDSLFYYNLIQTDTINLICLKNLKSLESLDLSRCRSVSDYLFSVPLRLKNLRELNLCGVEEISSRGVILLVHNCPSLENLDLSGSLVNDIGIRVLVQKLHRLKCLRLRFCKRITNRSLRFIIDYCKVLQILNLQDCYDLDEGLLQKIKNMPCTIEVTGRSIQTDEFNYRLPIAPPPPMYL